MLKALRMLALCHLAERPLRTIITVLGVALGVSVSVAIRTANVDVLRSFEIAVNSAAGRATLQVSGGDLGFDEQVIVAVRGHPGITSATPVLSLAARLTSGRHQGKVVSLLGLDLLEAGDLKDFEIHLGAEEDQMVATLQSFSTVFVGEGLAEEWSMTVGTPLELLVGTKRYNVIVEGIVHSDGGVASAWDRLVLIDIAVAQHLFGLVGRLDRIDVVTGRGWDVEQVQAEVQHLLPAGLMVKRPSHRNEQVERMLKAFQLNLTTLSAVTLLVGLLLVYNTVSYVVVQRRREIGLLCALGMTRRGVMALFVGEGALIGLVGGLAGGWLGMVLSHELVSLVKRSVSELYAPVPTVASAFGQGLPGLLLESALLGIVVSIIGAIGPSLEASRTRPARALAPGQYEEAQEVRAGRLAFIGCAGLVLALACALPGPVWDLPLFGYASALCLLLGLALMAPGLLVAMGRLCRPEWESAVGIHRGAALGRLAADQVARAPGRNAVTISALMVGIAIMLGVGIMVQSFRETVEHWIDQTIIADLILAPPAWPSGFEGVGHAHGISLAVADAAAEIPGVAAVDTYRVMKVELQGRAVSLVSRDLNVHATWARYLFLDGNSSTILRRTKEAEGMIISETLSTTMDVDVGDRLTLPTPSGERSFPVMGVFYDYATDGGKAVMDRELFRKLWKDETTTVIPLYLDRTAEAEVVRRRIEAGLARDDRLAVISNRDIKEEILAIFDRTFTVTYALELITVVIALLGIANTVLTSVLERQREMATLRAIGASKGQIRRLILWETAYLGSLGALMGVLAGVLLSILLIAVINRQSFGWTVRLTLPAELLMEAVTIAMVAAIAAGYLPALWAAKQQVAEGLRYE